MLICQNLLSNQQIVSSASKLREVNRGVAFCARPSYSYLQIEVQFLEGLVRLSIEKKDAVQFLNFKLQESGQPHTTISSFQESTNLPDEVIVEYDQYGNKIT